MRSALKQWVKEHVPPELYRPLYHQIRQSPRLWRRVLPVRWGQLRRLRPLSRLYGFDRGTPLDRYYVEAFLERHRADIRGRVLEVGGPEYTRRFGGAAVTHSDVLHVTGGNPLATIVGDLATGENVPREAFDCLILTQVLLCIYDVRAAVVHSARALKPGGVVLATLPGIAGAARDDRDSWGDYWRFTGQSARRLFAEAFPPENVTVEAQGSLLTGVAFLYGLAAEELRPDELAHRDPDYEFLITVRAVKPGVSDTPVAAPAPTAEADTAVRGRGAPMAAPLLLLGAVVGAAALLRARKR